MWPIGAKQNHKTQNRITKPKTETQNSKQNHKTQNRNTKPKTESQNSKRKYKIDNRKTKKFNQKAMRQTFSFACIV